MATQAAAESAATEGASNGTWKSWMPRIGRTARIVGMAVLAVPAVVWIRKVVAGRPRPGARGDLCKANGLTKEERERNERMEAYAAQIVANVVSQALEQYKRETGCQ